MTRPSGLVRAVERVGQGVEVGDVAAVDHVEADRHLDRQQGHRPPVKVPRARRVGRFPARCRGTGHGFPSLRSGSPVDGPALCRSRALYTALRRGYGTSPRAGSARRGETACPWRSKTSSSDAVREGREQTAMPPGSERVSRRRPTAWPLRLASGCRFALAALVIGWPWLSGTRHHPLGRQGALPAADPVPGAEPRARRVAVLGALRVHRPPADRRPPVDDLLAALPAAGPAQLRAQPVGRRCDAAGHGVPAAAPP